MATYLSDPRVQGRGFRNEDEAKKYIDYIEGGWRNPQKPATEGIQLPDANIPNQAGASVGTPQDYGISTSRPARSYDDIKKEIETEMAPSRQRLEKSFSTKMQDLTQMRGDVGRSLGGALGTNRRASTSAQAYIKFVDEDYKKRIATLEMQRDEALENADSQMLSAINSRLQAERQAWIQEQDQAMKMLEFQRKSRADQIAEEQTFKEQEQERMAPYIKALKQSAVIDAYKQNIEDPAEIFDFINKDERGQMIGDISIEEITGTLEKFKKEQPEIDKLLVELGKQGAPGNIIDKVSKSTSLADAVKNSGDWLQTGSGVVGEYLFYKRDALAREIVPADPNTFWDWDANRKKSIAAAGVAGGDYTSAQGKFITSLNNSVSKNSTYSKTTSMRNYGDNVLASLSQGTGVGDIAAINQFQKVIDEGAVTRDQDVKLIQGAQSLANTLQTKIKKLAKGEQLSPELRKQMRTAVESMYEAQVKALQSDPFIKSKIKEAEINGIDVEDTILGELESFTKKTDNLIQQQEQAKTTVDTFLSQNTGKPIVTQISNLYKSGKFTDQDMVDWLKKQGYKI
jgi:hypothetical protein